MSLFLHFYALLLELLHNFFWYSAGQNECPISKTVWRLFGSFSKADVCLYLITMIQTIHWTHECTGLLRKKSPKCNFSYKIENRFSRKSAIRFSSHLNVQDGLEKVHIFNKPLKNTLILNGTTFWLFCLFVDNGLKLCNNLAFYCLKIN